MTYSAELIIVVLVCALPFLLPNDKVYLWTRATLGKVISGLTIKYSTGPLSDIRRWVLNTIAAICSAISDEVRGIPAAEHNGGTKASEYASHGPAPIEA